MALTEEIREKVQDILDRERWQGYISGKVEGALNVLYLIDLDKEERLKILSEAIGLSRATAEDFLKPREIEERIYKNDTLSSEDKSALSALMKNKAMNDEKVIEHPRELLEFVSKLGKDKFIEECLPQVDLWIKNGEEVSMRRVRDWIIDKYDLF